MNQEKAKIQNKKVQIVGQTIKMNNEEWRKKITAQLETKRVQREVRNSEELERKLRMQRRLYLYDKYVTRPGNYLERVEKWTGDPDSCPKIQLPREQNDKMTEMQLLQLRTNKMIYLCH